MNNILPPSIPSKLQSQRRVSFADVKLAANDHWIEFLTDAGLPLEILDARSHPCPKRCAPDAGGKDRFSASKLVNQTGAVYCRRCFNKGSSIKPGDGIASIAWILGISNRAAADWVADRLHLTASITTNFDIVAATALDKRIPLDAFKLFGVRVARRGRDNVEVARVNVYNEAGVVHSHFDVRPGVKGWLKKNEKRGDRSGGLFFPGRVPVPGETWIGVEGVKDAAALVGLGYNAFGYCGSRLASKYARLFSGVAVVLLPDLDIPGRDGVQVSAARLYSIASSVAIGRLPGEIKATQGDDVRDTLKKPDGESLVRLAIADAADWTPTSATEEDLNRAEVILDMVEARTTDQVISSLGQLGWHSNQSHKCRVFVRGGALVQIIDPETYDPNDHALIREVPPSIIRERITQACKLFTIKESDEETRQIQSRPPDWLIGAVHRRGNYGGAIKPLTGIIFAPTIRPDGSILQTPGYDRATGLIYEPSLAFPAVPELPSLNDARDAYNQLVEVVADFPLLEGADRSAWVAMLLTMIARPCVTGCIPLFVVTANIRGAGKSKLVDMASIIAYGRTAVRTDYTRKDEEMKKVILSIAIGATPCVLFDNLDVQLGGASLDAAITAAVVSGRILGESRMTGAIPLKTIFTATGNNVAFGTDIARRVLPLRLRSPEEKPENRTGFVHENLEAWVFENRATLATAALTLVRAFYVAGCPVQKDGQWGSFENWSHQIRGAIVWCGGVDPLPTRQAAVSSDDSLELLSKLILGIESADPMNVGLTTKEIRRKTFGDQSEEKQNQILVEAISDICGERFNAHRVGCRIRSLVDRVWQGRSITSTDAAGGAKRYTIRKHSSPPTTSESDLGEFSGFVCPPADSNVGVSLLTPVEDTPDWNLNKQECNPSKSLNPLLATEMEYGEL